MDGGAWWAAVHRVAQSQTWLRGLSMHACIGEGMATHSSVLAWRIPGTGEPGGLPSMGSHRVGHDWSDLAAAAATEVLYGWKIFLYAFSLLSWKLRPHLLCEAFPNSLRKKDFLSLCCHYKESIIISSSTDIFFSFCNWIYISTSLGFLRA